jgi:hypothetical protein
MRSTRASALRLSAAAAAETSTVAPSPSCSVEAPNGLPSAALNCTFAAAWKASKPPASSNVGTPRASIRDTSYPNHVPVSRTGVNRTTFRIER